MTETMIGLYDASGKHVATVASLDGIDMTGLTQAPVQRGEEPQQVQAELLAMIEAQRIAALDQVLTPDKGAIYAAKAREVERYDDILPLARDAMSAEEKAETWPYATAEIAVDASLTLGAVITKFRAGVAESTAAAANIEARAQLRREAVKAATSAAAKRAAFASITPE